MNQVNRLATCEGFFYCLFDMSMINTGTGGSVVVLGRYDLSLSNWNQSQFYEKKDA